MSSSTSAPLRVRFAPSPTGALHIGGARTALYNWLAARGTGGKLILRIEDTDRERSTPENVEQIIDALEWLELDWDEGPYSQYEQRDVHREYIDRLLADGKAYYDTATSEDIRAWKAEHGNVGYRGIGVGEGPVEGAAIRLRLPETGTTVVHDLIRGDVAFENALLDDQVIARADGTPVYNFAVAVDDATMAIDIVIRGDDHLSNTPKQLLMFEALGIEPPQYAHLPLLHGPDGKKLSKRHGAASVQELRDAGYLPAAVRNYLALLGWGTDDDTTLMDTDELVRRFDIRRVGKAAAIFDEKKLRWMNGRFMREMAPTDYAETLLGFLKATDSEAAGLFESRPVEYRIAACEIVGEKAQTLVEAWNLIRFLFAEQERDEKAWRKFMKPENRAGLEKAAARLAAIADGDWGVEAIEAELTALLEETGIKPKDLYQPIRVSITGTSVSPGIFESVAVLGRDVTLSRIEAALADIPVPD